MAARTIELTDAVVAFLNGLSLSQVFTAEKKLVVTEDLHDVQDLKVYVVPAPIESVVAARGSEEENHTIYVTIMRKADNDSELEEMLEFKEEISDGLKLQIMQGSSYRFSYLGQQNDPQYSNEMASTKAMFMSVLRVRYKTSVTV